MLRDLEEGTYGNEEIISAPDMWFSLKNTLSYLCL
jgi:hypothetical protein